jgi:hypothetical protein
VLRWADNHLLDLKWEEIGEHYGRYRLHVPEAERAMARSLERYGQLSPVVVCRHFSAPAANVSGGNFLVITSAAGATGAGDERQLRFGLHLSF